MPQLRFPGFNGEWNCLKLNDFAERVTRKNGSTSDIPLTISAQHGLIDQRTFFSKAVASADMSGYYLLKNGEFAYNRSSSGEFPFGSIKRLDQYKAGAVSTLYICFGLRDQSPVSDFIKWYFDSSKWHREAGLICAEGARNHGLLNVPTVGFFNTVHHIPVNKDEQEKIAVFLSLVDRRLTAQRRLVELLKKHKRGLLRYVFEENIEGDYYSFSEIASRQNEKITPTKDSRLDCIELENIEQETGMLLGSVPLSGQNSLKNLCKPSDIVFGKLRPYLRKFVFAENECAVSSETWVLVAAKGIYPKFLFYLIQSEPFMRAASVSSGTKMPRSEWSNVANAKFYVPDRTQQETIAACFSEIDRRILTSQRILTAAQAYKRGLLQQLFV